MFLTKNDEYLHMVATFLKKKVARIIRFNYYSVFNIITGDDSDIEKINKMKIIAKNSEKFIPSQGREDSRIEDTMYLLHKFCAKSKMKVNYFLDLGSSEGRITEVMTKKLGLDNSHSFACDVIEQKYNESFSFHKSTDTFLPYTDSKFDLIIIFMTFHHFKSLEIIREIKRVIKNNGIVIVREHDATTETRKKFYNFVHLVYSCVLKEEMTPEIFIEEMNNGGYNYVTKDELISIFEMNSFRCVDTLYKYDMFNSVYCVFVPNS